jgi:hypothetical protein
VLDAIPQTADPEATHRVEAEPMPEGSSHEASLHG